MKGSITVFMSLCLTVCLMFIGTLLESARVGLIRSQIFRGTEAALDSLFAGYDGDLFDEFGILLLNIADLEEYSGVDEAVKEGINAQLQLNSDRFLIGGNLFQGENVTVKTVNHYSAVAKEGELFARSVLDYMKYRIPVSLTADVIEMLNLIDEGDTAKEGAKAMEQQENVLLEAESENGNLDEDTFESYEELVDESIIGKIEELRKNGYLGLLIPSDEVISAKTTTKSGFPSNYYSGGSVGSGNLLADIANNILYGEYLLEHFSGFTEESENQVMEYELEYILYGNASDRKNLEACIQRLLLVREGMNILAIYRDQSLEVQADAFAAALAGWTGIAPLVEVVKTAVIGAWAYAESLVDVRTLLAGYPVPLMKKTGEWSLELDKVSELLKGTHLSTGHYENGLEYQDYLRLLLLMMEEEPKYYRTMDMIQCRLTAKKPRFYMQECIYALEVEVTVEASPLFLSPFGQRNWTTGGYKIETGASRMY